MANSFIPMVPSHIRKSSPDIPLGRITNSHESHVPHATRHTPHGETSYYSAGALYRGDSMSHRPPSNGSRWGIDRLPMAVDGASTAFYGS